MPKIALIGDSVLDNFYWLNNKSHDLSYELTQLRYNVNNFAVDESQLHDVIHGIVPNDVYSRSRSYPYPCNDEGKVVPIELLQKHNDIDMSVVSVIGNDFRVKLWKITKGVNYFIDSILNDNYISDYNHLITNIKLRTHKMILVCVYIPYIGPNSPFQLLSNYSSSIYDRIREFIISLGRKYDIPVLDLSRTFDPYNREHYGSTVIEPSNLSNKCIADCIDYIYRNYCGHNVYYAPKCNSNNILKD